MDMVEGIHTPFTQLDAFIVRLSNAFIKQGFRVAEGCDHLSIAACAKVVTHICDATPATIDNNSYTQYDLLLRGIGLGCHAV
jgi:hypothetical protein